MMWWLEIALPESVVIAGMLVTCSQAHLQKIQCIDYTEWRQATTSGKFLDAGAHAKLLHSWSQHLYRSTATSHTALPGQMEQRGPVRLRAH